MSGETLFVTGVTGFLGRHCALRLLRRPETDKLLCLVRAKDDDHAMERLARSLRKVVEEDEVVALLQRIAPVVGDLTLERFGLDQAAWDTLAARCHVVLHSAADIRFDRDLEGSRRYNVFGTQQAAALSRSALAAGVLRRFDYVGTAFVAGLRRDRVRADELRHEEGWKNSYEQSKYEAEAWLLEHCSDLPLTVFRPSIIVGESTTGATTNFGMLYWPIQIYARGWWRTIVGRANTPVDFVPVDFVADAMEALSRPGSPIGGAYHLAAGPEGSKSIDELALMVRSYFGGKPARYMDADFFLTWIRPIADLFIWGKKRRVIREGGKFFIPYMDGNPIFDIERTKAALGPLGLSVPKVDDYMGTLLDYCKRTDFGKVKPGA